MLGRRALLAGAAVLGAANMIAAAFPARDYDDPDAVYDALRSQPATMLDIGASRIAVVFADSAPGLDRERVLAWVRRSAAALAAYFGHYPTRHYGLLVVADGGDRIGHATTYGYRGSVTRIHVGEGADERAFLDDWVLVHEMVHTALPDLPRRALWLQEGNATWVEPVARAQAGGLAATDVWKQAIQGMPAGLRDQEAGGMDGTSDWGRLYWGGAIFWLEAEIAIFQQSRGRYLLRDALRAVNRASGGNSVTWSPESLMSAADAATGTAALRSLYARYSTAGPSVDLPALFRLLGVHVDPLEQVGFDAGAPLAMLTRRITQP